MNSALMNLWIFCEKIGAEAYICANAGTGTPEDISDWVEYCNLKSEGIWAKKRIENGHSKPYSVKYWSIGNENYGDWEMGAKSPIEWGRYVKEAAKMMKRVRPESRDNGGKHSKHSNGI